MYGGKRAFEVEDRGGKVRGVTVKSISARIKGRLGQGQCQCQVQRGQGQGEGQDSPTNLAAESALHPLDPGGGTETHFKGGSPLPDDDVARAY